MVRLQSDFDEMVITDSKDAAVVENSERRIYVDWKAGAVEGDLNEAVMFKIEEAAAGANPQASSRVLTERKDIRTGQAVSFAESGEARAVIAGEPVVGTKPEKSGPILEHAIDVEID